MARGTLFRSWARGAALAAVGVACAPWPALAQDAAKVGVVSHLKVLSDKVEDVSSPEAWKKSCVRDGMSDQEKVLAIWRTVVKYRHQTSPPNEWIQDNVHDVFKTIHVYGYGMCCCASSHVETLARDKRDGYDVAVSYDGGKQFRPVLKLGGPTAGETRYFTISEVPPGTRAAQLRLQGRTYNTTMLFGLRIDADYKQPHGGFRPVKITYLWEENGAPKRHEHVAARPEETYTIRCGPKTVVKGFAVDLAK